MLFWKNRKGKNSLGQFGNTDSANGVSTSIKVDLTYSSKSKNPQSGIAVGQAIDAANTSMSSKIAGVLRYKGSVGSYSQLPTEKATGDVWNTSDNNANYVWNGTKVDSFDSCFYSCKAVTGNLPALWESHPDASYTDCFKNCALANNYDKAVEQGWA